MPEGVELDYNLTKRIHFDCKMRTGVMKRRWNNMDALHSSLSDLWKVISGEEVPDSGQSRPELQPLEMSVSEEEVIRRAFRASVTTMGGTVANSPDRRSPGPRRQ